MDARTIRSIHFSFAEFIISLFDLFKKKNAYLYISVKKQIFCDKAVSLSIVIYEKRFS